MQRATVVGIITLFLSSAAAAVCGQPQPRLVCAEYFKEQVVVLAKLVRTKNVGTDQYVVGRFYTFSVQKTLRGSIDPTFRVWEENSSGRAGFDWVKGRSYLLFLSFKPEDHTSWMLDGCGNSGPLSKAGKALKAIERIDTKQGGGFVTGNVASESSRNPLRGVSILVRGHGQVYRGATNTQGNFEIRVPPGVYEVKARQRGWLFPMEDLSYEDPRSIEIQNGSCVQVQFVGHQAP